MRKTLILLFGILAYMAFLPTFLYLIAFVGNLQQTALVDWVPALTWLVPRSISFGVETQSPALAVVINLALIALFGLQHSVMARTGFKQWLKRSVPGPAERSIYVLMSTAVLALLLWQWRPLGPVLWSIESTAAQTVLWCLFAAGFAMVFVSTFLIDHFDLFGLRQVWTEFRGRDERPPHFVTPLLYRVVRHPLYLGFLIAFWAAPMMTLGHALFAAAMTAYMLIGIHFEERDLVTALGPDYQRYQRQVPRLIPRPGRKWHDIDRPGPGTGGPSEAV